ncbi:LPS assembly lipoprotein LptE [Bdellovibrionota bacterium]
MFSLLLINTTGCGYHLPKLATFPHGVTKVAIPVFNNKTLEANVEVPMTNALLTEVYKSKYVEVQPFRKDADAVLLGTITKFSNSQVARTRLPVNRDITLTREYLVRIDVDVKLVRISDKKVLYQQTFWDTERYLANPRGRGDVTRNEDRKRLAINSIAINLGEDIHDALTWNF